MYNIMWTRNKNKTKTSENVLKRNTEIVADMADAAGQERLSNYCKVK